MTDINSHQNKSIQRYFKEDEMDKLSYKNHISEDFQSEFSDGKRLDSDDPDNYYNLYIRSIFLIMIGRITNNPPNKIFVAYYEIPYYAKNDFIFEFKGDLSKSDFMEKTKNLRSYPNHLKSTLFINKKQNIDFSSVYHHFEKVKEKGNKFYKKQTFKTAIESYIQVL